MLADGDKVALLRAVNTAKVYTGDDEPLTQSPNPSRTPRKTQSIPPLPLPQAPSISSTPGRAPTNTSSISTP